MSDEKLWCIVCDGPGDCCPMPSKADAARAADELNADYKKLRESFGIPDSAPRCWHRACEWPHSPEMHAEMVGKIDWRDDNGGWIDAYPRDYNPMRATH